MLYFALLSLLMSCDRPSREPSDGPGGGDGLNLVIIVLDGVRMEESFGDGASSLTGEPTAAFLPRLRAELLPQGTLLRPAWSLGVTSTAQAHCALLTGLRHEYETWPLSSDADVGAYRPPVATLFETVRAAADLPASRSVLLQNTDMVASLTSSLDPRMAGRAAEFWTGRRESGGFEYNDAVLAEAQERIREDRPRLIVMNLHAMDRSGHNEDLEGYLSRARSSDWEIADFWAWLQEQEGYADNTVLALLSDHGRHSGPERWYGHGDDCVGCRALPVFLAGPGVAAGEVVETPYALEDVGATLAHLLGVPLPASTGLLITEALSDAPAAQVSPGQAWPALAGGTLLAQGWGDDPQRRSQVLADSDALTDIFAAEAPAAAAFGEARYACWRELPDPEDGQAEWPWAAACRRKEGGGSWETIGSPLDPAHPSWRPALAADESGLWAAWNGRTADKGELSGLYLARWYAETSAWSEPLEVPGALEPAGVSLALDGEAALLAAEVSATDSEYALRYTRSIAVYTVSGGSAQRAWLVGPTRGQGLDLTLPYDRLAAPALSAAGSSWNLAFLAIQQTGEVRVLWTRREGAAWTEPAFLPDNRRVLAHVAPIWTGEALTWAQVSAADTVEICRGVPGSADAACQDTGEEQILGLAAEGGTAAAGLRSGDDPWTIRSFSW